MVGTVTASARVLVGQVVPVAEAPTPPAPAHPGVRFVATGMKLTEEVRTFLSTALGDEYAVVDIRRAPETVDALLVPPLSAQALGILRTQFPQARLIITELSDADSDVHVAGPVTRAMAAGAHAYLAPGTLGDLASEVRLVVEGRSGRALTSGDPTQGAAELAPGGD